MDRKLQKLITGHLDAIYTFFSLEILGTNKSEIRYLGGYFHQEFPSKPRHYFKYLGMNTLFSQLMKNKMIHWCLTETRKVFLVRYALLEGITNDIVLQENEVIRMNLKQYFGGSFLEYSLNQRQNYN